MGNWPDPVQYMRVLPNPVGNLGIRCRFLCMSKLFRSSTSIPYFKKKKKLFFFFLKQLSWATSAKRIARARHGKKDE